jgi:hypothetical protein
MSDTFDPTPYVRPPVLNVASAVGLSTALIAAAPKTIAPAGKKALKHLRDVTIALQDKWRAAENTAKAEDPRPADLANDTAWGALHGRLEAFASLDHARVPRAARAEELMTAIFPEGLTFLRLPYAEEWAESQKRLDRIERDGLEKDLEALAGKEFLAEVRAAHARYGKTIGTTAPLADAPPAAALAEPLRAVSTAVARYALQLSAMAADGDEAAVAEVVKALRPIDDHRDDAGRRGKGRATPASTETPVPPLPTTP